jgi:hypothetical protein
MSEENTAQNLYKCSPRETRAFIIDCIEAGLVPSVESSPGMGKSSLVHSIATEFEAKLIDHRLSTSSPVDLTGFPVFENGKANFSPFEMFPTADQDLPKGKNGWILFLDEFNSAPKSVQAAAYKLILDRAVGQHQLHPACAIVAAGNLATDRAITNPLSTAMQSRLVHIEMELSHREWLEDVALKQNYDPRVIAFLNYMPGKLMDFKPDHNEKTFCCPRTWEFVNRLIQGKELTQKKTKLLAGTITSGVAVEFVNFTSVYQNMPTIRQILSDPEGMFVPTDPPTRWAVISHLMEKVTPDNFKDVCVYVNRFPSDFRVLFFRSVLIRQPAMRTRPEFAKAMSELSRYIHGD